ncbi:MAG: FHA domain-containing serine/threonine-protein kinase [Candidatus Ozemobacteraceae bacterium]
MASIQLKVLHGELKGRVLEFSQPECVLLGRVDDALICLPDDPFISRHHLLMEICPPSILLSDLGSKNGFFVNDQHYGGVEANTDECPETSPSRSILLSDEDLILVGTNRFHIKVSSANTLSRSPQMKAGSDMGVRPSETMIDRYLIIQEIGRSWMGAVYKAIDTRSGEEVALKMMLPNVDFSEESADAFQKELGRLQALDHPCIGRLKDFRRLGNCFYCVQEFIDGMDLSKLLKLRGGKLELEEAVPIMLDLLEGLSYAYTNGGFVHRNLKPRNILTWGNGRRMRARAADFGLFRALEIAGLHRTIHSRLNFDSPCYWPRERITFFNRADAASEVFSAAAIFYQMLTGCLVRHGLFELQSKSYWQDSPPGLADYLTLMATNQPVPVKQREPGIPVDLAKTLDRALSEPIIRRGVEDPGSTLSRERFPDPASFRAALLEVLPKDLARTATRKSG